MVSPVVFTDLGSMVGLGVNLYGSSNEDEGRDLFHLELADQSWSLSAAGHLDEMCISARQGLRFPFNRADHTQSYRPKPTYRQHAPHQLGNDGDVMVQYQERQERSSVVLSHTWRDEEVSFYDFQRPNRANKTGFKILTCCKQAREDGIEWV